MIQMDDLEENQEAFVKWCAIDDMLRNEDMLQMLKVILDMGESSDDTKAILRDIVEETIQGLISKSDVGLSKNGRAQFFQQITDGMFECYRDGEWPPSVSHLDGEMAVHQQDSPIPTLSAVESDMTEESGFGFSISSNSGSGSPRQDQGQEQASSNASNLLPGASGITPSSSGTASPRQGQGQGQGQGQKASSNAFTVVGKQGQRQEQEEEKVYLLESIIACDRLNQSTVIDDSAIELEVEEFNSTESAACEDERVFIALLRVDAVNNELDAQNNSDTPSHRYSESAVDAAVSVAISYGVETGLISHVSGSTQLALTILQTALEKSSR